MNERRPLEGTSALITGASRGLGLAIAEAYIAAGASLMLCGREQVTIDAAVNQLRTKAGADQQVHGLVADVANEVDVRTLIERTLEIYPDLSILVCNAGVYGPFGAIEDVDWADWVKATEINLYGSILPARFLMRHFRGQGRGKIVQISGGGATAPLPRISAYAASKAAVIRFMETLAEETRGTGIDVNGIAPGALNTKMLDDVLAAGPEQVGESFYQRSLKQRDEGGAGLQKGADLAVWLASIASDGITGKLLSAVWDPWETLNEHADEISGDVYTLRRIVPADRGLSWG